MPTQPYYNKAGVRIPGNTTVIENCGWNKRGLMHWAWQAGIDGKQFTEMADTAATIGTCGMEQIECNIRGVKFKRSKYFQSILKKADTTFGNYLEWKATVNFKPEWTEVPVVSEKYQFGTTLDCIGMVNGKLSNVEVKTTNNIYETHLIQMAAQRVAWEETYPDRIMVGGFHLLRLPKEYEGFHHYHWHTLDMPWQVFLHLRELHKLKPDLKKLT